MLMISVLLQKEKNNILAV